MKSIKDLDPMMRFQYLKMMGQQPDDILFLEELPFTHETQSWISKTAEIMLQNRLREVIPSGSAHVAVWLYPDGPWKFAMTDYGNEKVQAYGELLFTGYPRSLKIIGSYGYTHSASGREFTGEMVWEEGGVGLEDVYDDLENIWHRNNNWAEEEIDQQIDQLE